MSDSPQYEPDAPGGAGQPADGPPATVDDILEAMRKQGVTDLRQLAEKIVEEEESDESVTDSTFVWSGDSYVYHHVEHIRCW